MCLTPSEDSDQPIHTDRSEFSLGAFWIAKGEKFVVFFCYILLLLLFCCCCCCCLFVCLLFFYADNKESDRTARIRKMI